MNNAGFLRAIESSFEEFIRSGTSRSTRKLVPLHGAIAQDMHERLGSDYDIRSQGFRVGREGTIPGRYMDKKVDISVFKAGRAVGGIAVKFVMQNYSQNSNNYFENMLGETANIRAARCPYFQVFIIPEKLPYYDKAGEFKHWETFTDNNIHKYSVLDMDDPDSLFHCPNKTLIYVVKLPEVGEVTSKGDYINRYKRYFGGHGRTGYLTAAATAAFSRSVIVNDYERFADKAYHAIMAL